MVGLYQELFLGHTKAQQGGGGAGGGRRQALLSDGGIDGVQYGSMPGRLLVLGLGGAAPMPNDNGLADQGYVACADVCVGMCVWASVRTRVNAYGGLDMLVQAGVGGMPRELCDGHSPA